MTSTMYMEAGVLRWEKIGADEHARDKLVALSVCLSCMVVFWVAMFDAWRSWFGDDVVNGTRFLHAAPRRAGSPGRRESKEERVWDEEEQEEGVWDEEEQETGEAAGRWAAIASPGCWAQARHSDGSARKRSLPGGGCVHSAGPQRSSSVRSQTDSAQRPGFEHLVGTQADISVIETRLKAAKEWHRQGLIDHHEYQKTKTDLLSELKRASVESAIPSSDVNEPAHTESTSEQSCGMDVQSFYSLQEHMGHHYTGSDANESLPDLDDWMKELKRVTRERTAQRRKSPTDPSSKDSRRRSTVDCHERCEPAACKRHEVIRAVPSEPARSRPPADLTNGSGARRGAGTTCAVYHSRPPRDPSSRSETGFRTSGGGGEGGGWGGVY